MNEELKEETLHCLSLLGKENKINSMADFNLFCSTLLGFADKYQTILTNNRSDDDQNEVIFLCLKQICTCIKCLERTMKSGLPDFSSTPRQHFFDRIRLCLERVCSLLHGDGAHQGVGMGHSFFDLMDIILDFLESSDEDDGCAAASFESVFLDSYGRKTVDEILRHALAFANVTLNEDKHALSALCQQVLRECICLHKECQKQQCGDTNNTNRKLKATSLLNSLYKLEDHLNKSLLRLIYTCFLGYDRYSTENLRILLRCSNLKETTLDEFIADFDINLDRTTQIGVFATAFAMNVKTKTIVRSCLASFEALDSFLIPSVLAQPNEYHMSGILEQHFNEEVYAFKNVIQEIIDSYAFAQCYQDILDQCIVKVEKEFSQAELHKVVEMAQILCSHFNLKTNFDELLKEPARMVCYEKFEMILLECQAILLCTEQVDRERVFKRFKILRSVLAKLVEALQSKPQTDSLDEGNSAARLCGETVDSQQMFLDLSPSTSSISYCDNAAAALEIPSHMQCNATAGDTVKPKILRKESLRTTIFKRKKFMDAESDDSTYDSIDLTKLLISSK